MTAVRLTRDARRGCRVSLWVNDDDIDAFEGETLAAVLMAAGKLHLRDSPRGGARGAFCFMGVCQECLVRVDGVARQSCLMSVSDGMRVTL